MGKRPDFRRHVLTLTTEKRIEDAKEIVENLTYRVQTVLQLHAANEIVVYSSQISGQIEPSDAARAFEILRDGLFQVEIVRLLALWDPPDFNAVSIPSALLLIDDPSVIDQLCKGIFEAHSGRPISFLNPSGDLTMDKAIRDAAKQSQEDFAYQQVTKGRIALKACIDAAAFLADGDLGIGLSNLRDRIAHSLTQTRREIRGENAQAKYGQERKVLERTIAIIEDLYCWVNGVSFDISGDCFDNAREDASDFWGNLKFIRES